MKGFSVYRRRARPVWYISFLSAESGRWRDVASVFRVDDPLGKRKAQRLGERYAAEFFAVHKDAAVRSSAAWSAWVPGFLKMRHRNSPRTLTSYEGAWDRLREFIELNRIPMPMQLEYRHALDYLAWRTQMTTKHSGKPPSRNTALQEVKVWAMLAHEAVRRGFALGNPIARMGERRDPPKPTPDLTRDDIARWRAALAAEEGARPLSERWMTIAFEIALHQGCRLRETQIPLAAVDFEKRFVTFKIKGARGKPRQHIAPLHPELWPMFDQLKAAGASQTCELPRMAAKLLWQFRQRHGLGHTKFHSTRVAVISEFARQGVPEAQSRAYVAHSSRVVHQIYQRLRPEDLRAATAALRFGPGPTDAESHKP